MTIGHNVSVQEHTWLAAVPWTGNDNCQLIIGDNVSIGAFNHIYATGKIVIEHSALTANSVYITDNLHQYEDICMPIKEQPIRQLNEVIIGEGCWIGEHATIIGASIGKHSVVGANAVVTHDIPDYCVAVGSPAYIIKRYNPNTHSWVNTDKQGNFY